MDCALAQGFGETMGLFNALTDTNLNKSQLMQSLELTVGGWLETGYTFNPDEPKDRFNGPVIFNNRANELLVNEFYLFLENDVNIEGDRWDFGGRVDFLFGTDARFTQATGLDNNIIGDNTFRLYKFAIPQLYAETFVPYGKGITVRLGHFYTPIGVETVTAPGNFFYSHTYTAEYGEPFTHTGFLISYPLTDHIGLSGGGVLGWDNFSKDPKNLNFLGVANWNSVDQRTSLSFTIITGNVSGAGNAQKDSDHNLTLYSIVMSHDFTDFLHYTFQQTLGGGPSIINTQKSGKWFGISQYLYFSLKETLSTGLRFEWFRDDKGTRVFINDHSGFPISAATNYFAITAGLNWRPLKWITVRPEVRYDWATDFNAFDNNSDKNQFLVAADIIIRF
ncbi:porin [Nitrosococcus watsonii]|uniref:Porin n=1 Tax=Nitrosococcus watsoni (strain C-113) TaxID=105559 RepID=D8K6Y5_NITWC|nr:porin [Nitrosococcus watsonii]ADJ28662.1 protein of unknown function DUF1597 [Nitrosococcus watsonii C-113]